jgi:von Willebrand factor type A domain
VITGVGASLIAAAIVAVATYLMRDPEPVRQNVELILDISRKMKEDFGNTNRFNAAIEALDEYVEPLDTVNLALWTSGGGCEDKGTDELVPFRQDNSDRIRAALGELEPGGRANLGDSIVRGAGAFSDVDRFPAEVQKSIFIFTAGKDTCGGDYIGELESRLGAIGEDIDVKLHFFGLDMPEHVTEELRDLAQERPDQIEIEDFEDPSDLPSDLPTEGGPRTPPQTPTLTPTLTPSLTPTLTPTLTPSPTATPTTTVDG